VNNPKKPTEPNSLESLHKTPEQLFFGTQVRPQSLEQWLQHLTQVVARNERQYLCGHHNLHSLFLVQKDESVRAFYERCNNCYIDGMPVRALLRAFDTSTNSSQRFSLMNSFYDVLAHAQQLGWRVFYLGSDDNVVAQSRTLIGTEFPQLHIELMHGFQNSPETPIAAINAMRPHLLLLGMGMPLQEQWINQHLSQLEVNVVTQAGATLDYVVGAQAKPPQWVARIGFAWLYRLANDPARLWRRYLLEPWGLVVPAFKHWQLHRRQRT